ncbi:tRNA (adenine-N(1)-)-methyltransferase catalytic subunit trm61 [Tieghemiomyces parasiticus]|uniref:tRNA (adenine(58)-N(1))-methyltransferase catalytic subunit TRM61 n=1 Tax=Tieghemiomyces parasiticus TaxID=78921 RepID=A0A9W8AAT2_9FUNG|nr:tRNA (adenine-N(1)-)-methyltransferase catalytic subunit trm61 [Tieghemiomyces parasiticus]
MEVDHVAAVPAPVADASRPSRAPFFRYKDVIEEGDLVITYLSQDLMSSIVIDATKTCNNKYGSFSHKDMIGKKYGSKVISKNGKFMHLLFPTPELWTLVLPHRTQILYQPDISFISSYLDLTPGKKMIESGTGSGSFSHSIARSLAPNGHLYSFEYHENRFKQASAEFKSHGIDHLVTVQHRDVCANGFGLNDEVNAVFLDLPSPWEAVGSAKAAFKQNIVGKLCSFSPCIEQVQRTCLALSEHGFTDIIMFEVLVRNHNLRSEPLPTIQTAIQRHANQIAAKDEHEAKKQELRKLQQQQQQQQQPELEPSQSRSGSPPSKRVRTTAPESDDRKTDASAGDDSQASQLAAAAAEADLSLRKLTVEELNFRHVTRTPETCRGHTSYLTFATFVPDLSGTNDVKPAE